MLVRKLLSPKLELPPKLSQSEYLRQKILLSCYVVGWFAFLVFLYIKWFDLSLALRIVLGLVEFVFTPDIGTIKNLFRTFGDYENQN
jgi:hypothetical protein